MVELSELCAMIVDCEHKTAPKADEGYPLIRTTDIGRGRLDLSNVQRVDADTYEEWTQRAIPQPGDLILAREAPVGNVAKVGAGLEPVLGQRTVLIRPDLDQVDPDYLTYRLLAHDLQYWMNGVANGATVPHLNMEDIRALPMPTLPPLDEQRAIGGALAAFDDLIENNRRRIEILEEAARLIYREWFVRFRFPGHENVKLVDSERGKIPDNWVWGTFDDIVDVWRESISPEKIESGAPLVGLEHLPRRSTTLHQWGSANDVGSTKSLFDVGDILFGKIRPNFHKVVLAPISGYCSTDAVVFRPVSGSEGRALAVASSDEFVAQAVRTSNGTKMPRANTDVLLRYPVPIPSREVGDKFEALVGPMNQLCMNLSHQNRVLMQTRDLLLPRLISGELDVSDLNLDLEAVG